MTYFLKSYYETLAKYDVVLVQLMRNEKRTTRRWDYFEEEHDRRGETRLDLAQQWLRKGYGVGFLPRNGLFVVDCDDEVTAERMDAYIHSAMLPIPTVTTASGKKHFYGVPPQDMQRKPLLKNHVCHPKEDGEKLAWDFKIGERTLVVAAGTTKVSGEQIIGAYRPDRNWSTPPMFDPRLLAPSAEFFREEVPFLTDSRPLKDRIIAATSYLQHRAPVSVPHQGARRSLFSTASHLVAYLQLDPALAFHLMTHHGALNQRCARPRLSWNSRCHNPDGSAFPWSDEEIWQAVSDAVDSIPQAGIRAYTTQQQQIRVNQALSDFIGILGGFVPWAEGWMYAEDLYHLFLDENGLKPDECTYVKFGKSIAEANRNRIIELREMRKGHGRKRAYAPLSPEGIREAMRRFLSREHDQIAA